MLTLNRRSFIAAGASSLAMSGLSIPALAQDKPEVTIAIIGDGRTGPWAAARADITGYDFEKAIGARPRWQPGFTASLPVMEAIRSGDVDFTFATSTAVVNAVDVGIPIVPIAAFPLPVNTVDGVVRKESGIRQATDLRGRKVAYQRGTTGHFSLLKYLEAAGVDFSEVQGVSLTGADGFTALSQGEVDAWFHWQPAATIGLARLADQVNRLDGVPTYDYAFYVAREGFHQEHPEIAVRLAVAVREVQRRINADPAGTVAIWAANGGFEAGSIEAKAFEQLLTEKRVSESTAVDLRPADKQAADATQVLATSFYKHGVLPREVDLPGFILDPRFDPVREAVAGALAA
ncbi:ABC transporter substrate-binding protein [Mesorhizobium sp. NPDC059054]|uniref:ABC transporter substrate-binding protein n=1 Tax=Mesorhizobium sp. NPDC059054 TaxID=3346711 RepID=UPI00367EC8DA